MSKEIILIDLDNTLVDFDGYLISLFRKKFNIDVSSYINLRSDYKIEENLPLELRSKCISLITSESFFYNLSFIEGAKDCFFELDKSYELYLCTTPYEMNYSDCIKQKVNWVLDNLGDKWLNRLIFTSQKHLILGDYLIDDSPCLKNEKAQWNRVVYNYEYNLDLNEDRVSNWSDIRNKFIK